jgi:hypothetical protein
VQALHTDKEKLMINLNKVEDKVFDMETLLSLQLCFVPATYPLVSEHQFVEHEGGSDVFICMFPSWVVSYSGKTEFLMKQTKCCLVYSYDPDSIE